LDAIQIRAFEGLTVSNLLKIHK